MATLPRSVTYAYTQRNTRHEERYEDRSTTTTKKLSHEARFITFVVYATGTYVALLPATDAPRCYARQQILCLYEDIRHNTVVCEQAASSVRRTELTIFAPRTNNREYPDRHFFSLRGQARGAPPLRASRRSAFFISLLFLHFLLSAFFNARMIDSERRRTRWENATTVWGTTHQYQ